MKELKQTATLFLIVFAAGTALLSAWASGLYLLVVLAGQLPSTWEWIVGAPAGFTYVIATWIAGEELWESLGR